MKRTRTLRIWGGFWLLLLLLFTFLIWNIFAGSVSLSASEIWRILLGGDVDFTQSQIIMKIRLPRLLSALILGGALSLSGYLLQTFFHAGPISISIVIGKQTAKRIFTVICQSTGIHVRLIIDFFQYSLHFGSRLARYIGTVMQHTVYRTHRNTGTLGYIFNSDFIRRMDFPHNTLSYSR